MSSKKLFSIPTFLGLAVMGQLGVAHADVRNTYDGSECVAASDSAAGNLSRGGAGISASRTTVVICPVTKAIFNSTRGVNVSVSASNGTRCNLESTDVFQTNTIRSAVVSNPGSGISGIHLSIPSSFRGGMRVRCTLFAGGQILNYLADEL